MTWYRLVDKTPTPCSINEYVKFDIDDARCVRRTEFGYARVSTVFLGIDHSYTMDGSELFETMIFGCENYDDYQTRCATWDEAVEMHATAVKYVEDLR